MREKMQIATGQNKTTEPVSALEERGVPEARLERTRRAYREEPELWVNVKHMTREQAERLVRGEAVLWVDNARAWGWVGS
jgi:hypothetical protein